MEGRRSSVVGRQKETGFFYPRLTTDDSRLFLDPIFKPKSIALIGASRRESAVGHAVFKNVLLGSYQGIIYPVNSSADSVLGVRCYKSILDIPDPVDLAVLVVPSESAVSVFQECIKKGVRGAVVISAGFKEVGAEGAAREKELARLATKHRIPLVGPNCLGVINTAANVKLNASFGRDMPASGRIAFVSQSGALCTSVLDYAKGANIGFSKFISMGNKAQVTELELLEYLGEDKETDVILMYLEDLAHPRALIDAARHISGEEAHLKPILAIKSGRTAAGARAASSHTGSLAGSDEVYTAIFAQGGILRVDSVDELFDYAKAFSVRRFPKSGRIAIVTNAGGPGIMATDACVRHGLTMAELSDATRAELKKHLPSTASLSNPVDVIGDAQHDRYQAALKTVLRDQHVDSVLVILTPQAMTDIEEIARTIGTISSKSSKPILACFMGIVDVSGGVKILEQWNVPHYRFPESASRALGALARYAAWVKRPRTVKKEFFVNRKSVQSIFKSALTEGRKYLSPEETFGVLGAYGFTTLPMEVCSAPAQAGEAAKKIGAPVALKIYSPDIIHKIDVGGIRLNICSPGQAQKEAREMLEEVRRKSPASRILGVVVQKMAKKGQEVILGLKRDAQFGPMLMFGLGGTYVEIMKDVTFRIAPIRELGAHNMIHSIRSYPILEGVRGQRPADLAKLEECLERLSQLAVECPEIAELDINPLMAYEKGKGCVVVDARILLGDQNIR
ncbi:MAG: acetate--CoA ligase family protein [Candidatus Omnitrophica bacterium]|nr:acetate--CoA ligase family protein [Candidatus Omnitrophota bacterium]